MTTTAEPDAARRTRAATCVALPMSKLDTGSTRPPIRDDAGFSESLARLSQACVDLEAAAAACIARSRS